VEPEPTSDVRDEALALRARGWSVVPLHTPLARGCSCGRPECPSPGKHPRLPWERWRQQRATVDDVRRWWRRWPRANVGVVTGAVSGVIVLDIDPRNGGDRSLEDLEAGYGSLPATVEADTGGGGRHLYFRHPGRAIVPRPIAPGLDLKGDGGLIVAPPSLHPSGATYRWAPGCRPDDVELATAPAWVLALGGDGGLADAPPRRAPSRTAAERAEFAQLWAALGVDVAPGDQMYRCPLHEDHHPSLHVDADGCRWLCFGCHRGGGVGRLRRIVGGSEPRGEPAPIVPVTLAGGATIEVVGEARHQEALLALTGGRRHYGGVSADVIAHLVPEPGNPVDPDAIAVLIGGHKVGYLRREDAHRFRRAVDEAVQRLGEATCVASIRGGWERPGDVGMFGVRLWLAIPARTSGPAPAGENRPGPSDG